MSIIKFLKSRVFWINVLLAIVVTILLVMLTLWSLNTYTRSGRTIIVPDVKGNYTNNLEETLGNMELNYVVIDSVHKRDCLPGVIVEQIPAPGKTIKKGRTLFLTINAWSQELVSMPAFVNYSLRNAKVVSETVGLRISKVTYSPSEYSGLVLGQLIDGRQVKEGEKVPRWSNVELVVGSGTGGSSVMVPELIGLTKAEANRQLDDAMLVMGNVVYDNSVVTKSDTLTSVVYKQSPSCISGKMTTHGSTVNLWMTKNNDLVIDAMEEIENSRDNAN